MASLLLEKVKEYLAEQQIRVSRCFTEGKHVKFIECFSPKYQKPFIISIPCKYSVSVKGNKSVHIGRLEDIDSEQIEYLRNLADLDIETDIISLSSSMLCLYERSEKITTFKLNPKVRREDESDDESEEETDNSPFDYISKLENDISKLSRGLPKPKKEKKTKKSKGPKASEVGSGESPAEKEDSDDESESEKPQTKEPDFDYENLKEDESPDEDEIEQEEGYSSSEDEKIGLEFKEDSSESEPESSSDEDELFNIKKRPNDSLVDLSKDDIIIGHVYVCISLSDFYKIEPSTFEGNLIEIYETLNKNEEKVQEQRGEKIVELLDKLKSKIIEDVVEMKVKRKNKSSQIYRLGLALSKIEKVKSKTPESSKRRKEVDKIYAKTTNSIHDLNIEVLKIKDNINEMLINYEADLKEMLYDSIGDACDSDSDDEEGYTSDSESEEEEVEAPEEVTRGNNSEGDTDEKRPKEAAKEVNK